MKKSIYLIAPLAFLLSCSQTSEIFDDAYNDLKAPEPISIDENSGYADYIKNQEDNYTVKIDSSEKQYQNSSWNKTYYEEDYDRFTYGGGVNNNYNQYNNGYGGMNCCQYACLTYMSQGSSWHTRNDYLSYYNNGNGQCWNPYWNNYGQNHNIVYGSPYDPYNPYGAGYSGIGGYYNNYYGNGFGGYGNGYYMSYGTGYGYGSSFGYPYYGYNSAYWSGYGYGNNGWNGNNWYNGSNISAVNEGETSTGNYHYGHRGGKNGGTNSQNTTTYEHTVRSFAPAEPFPSYNETNDKLTTTTYSSQAMYESGTSTGKFISNNSSSQNSTNTNYSTTNYSTTEKINTSNEMYLGTNNKVVKENSSKLITNKPANNQFSTKNIENKRITYGGSAINNTVKGSNNNNNSSSDKYNTGNNKYDYKYTSVNKGVSSNSNNRGTHYNTTYSGSNNTNNNNFNTNYQGSTNKKVNYGGGSLNSNSSGSSSSKSTSGSNKGSSTSRRK